MTPATSAVRARPVRASGRRAPSGERRRSAAPASRPRLTVVARPAPRRSVVPFTLLCTAIIVGTLLGVLFLNLSMSSTSYEIARLQSQSSDLDERRQALQEQDDRLATPQELQTRADALGMVPAGETAYIDLATGTVIGEPGAAQAAGAEGPQPATAAPAPAATTPEADEPYFGMGGQSR